jgi:hypothetical protein
LAQIKKTLDLLKENKESVPGGTSKVEESVGESASLSHSKGKQITESYDTDTFEEHS